LAVLPLWQVSHVPVPTALAAECANATPEVQLAVLLWQPSQLPVTPAWIAVVGLPTAARKLPPAISVWQVTQPVLTVTLLCSRPLVHVAKPPRWQVSQLAAAAAATMA
jgi:hypothetical protein